MASIASRTIAPVTARVSNAETTRVQTRTVAPKAAFFGSAKALRVARPVNVVARQALSIQAAADRPMWLTGAPPPAHLDGSLPGDYGFDPLGLGSNPDRLKWYVEAERIHGRWAMAAAAGILFPPLLGVQTQWFEAGSLEYNIPFLPLLALQFPLMGFLETKRFNGFKETGQCGLINDFPFDPMGMGAGSKAMQVKEVKNGRLAMVSFVGFAVQALVTKAGPIADLQNHIASPVANNITTNVPNIGL